MTWPHNNRLVACGSMVLYLLCRLFFTPLGEKQPTKSEIRVMRTPYILCRS